MLLLRLFYIFILSVIWSGGRVQAGSLRKSVQSDTSTSAIGLRVTRDGLKPGTAMAERHGRESGADGVDNESLVSAWDVELVKGVGPQSVAMMKESITG